MSLGNLFSSLAPVAAGFLAGPGATALLAGAATGAGIAALRDEDPLMGAVTGGIGGYGGGQFGTAAQNVTKAGLGSYSAGPVQGMGSSLAQNVSQVPNVGAMEAAKTLVTNPGGVISNLGGGDMTKGALKAGAVGLPAVAGAMVPDMTTAEQNQMTNYDPNRRLNLNRDTGLRLLNEGGYLPYEFSESTTMDPERFRMFMMQREMREPSRDVVYDEGLQAIENERARVMRDPQVVENERARVLRRIDPNVGIEKENLDRYNALMERFEAERQAIKNMPEGPEKDEIMRMNDNFAPQEFYYNQGGYLDEGAGDGMSDEIMGDIDGTQPVRLSEGEFVVPADVVSHLGNGDSDSGAEQLYAMMDRVRQARTGTKKQGKEIKAERLMPA